MRAETTLKVLYRAIFCLIGEYFRGIISYMNCWKGLVSVLKRLKESVAGRVRLGWFFRVGSGSYLHFFYTVPLNSYTVKCFRGVIL